MYDNRVERRGASGGRYTTDLFCIAEDVGKNWLSILLLSLSAFILTFVLSSENRSATYSSSATVSVSNITYVSNVETYDMLGYATDVAKKVSSIMTSPELLDSAAKEAGYTEFKGSISAEQLTDTNLITVTITSDSPIASYLELKAVLNDIKKYQDRLSGGTALTVLNQPLMQETPMISASSMMIPAAAAMAAFVMICFILAVISARKNTVRNGSDAVSCTDTDFLGNIYRDKIIAAKEEVLITDQKASLRYKESIRRLAFRVARKMTANDQKVLLVTSAERGEGKSAVAANTALALAECGRKVVLMDMNFHEPKVHKLLKLQNNAEEGLAEFLDRFADSDTKEIEDRALELCHQFPDSNLSVIVSGKPSPNAADRYAEQLKTIIQTISRNADFVVIDTTPDDLYSDTEVLAAAADTSLLVIRRNYALTSQIQNTVNSLGGKERVLGCIMTDAVKYSAGTVSPETGGQLEQAGDDLIKLDNKSDLEVNLPLLFKDYVQAIGRNCVMIAMVMLLMGGLGYFAAKSDDTPVYTAYTTFAVNPVETVKFKVGNQKNICIALVGKMTPSIIGSKALESLITEDLGLEPSQGFPAAIDSTVVNTTNVVKLTVKSGDPQTAYEVMQSALKNYKYIADTAIGSVGISVIDESGVPSMLEKSSPNGKKMAAAGAVLGLIFSLIVIFARLLMKETVLSEEELTWLLRTECVGQIPWTGSKFTIGNKSKYTTIDAADAPAAFVESVRKLRNRIEVDAQVNGGRIFLVTSAVQSEGKTTVAANLALALMNHHHKVLLIDADLRKPSAMTALGMQQKEQGLSELLDGKYSLDQVLVSYKGNKDHEILPAGKAVDDPSPLWSRRSAIQLIQDAREQYDFIIIDASQSAIVSEIELLADLADACLFVVRRDYAQLDQICDGIETFEGTKCRFLGCVMRT